jgi:hypothetical protein
LIPQDDNYPKAIAAVVAHLVAGDAAGAERSIAELSYAKREVAKRPSIPRSVTVGVFRRDHWTCRYCGGKTIFTPVMVLLSEIYPEQFPYTPNWKAGLTHPAIISRSAVVDHVIPGSLGGDWRDEGNLVTACWPCNVRKGDLTLEQLGWTPATGSPTSWDGLTGSYNALWVAAGRPSSSRHLPWLRLLGSADDE